MEKLTKLAIAICRPKNSMPRDKDHTLPPGAVGVYAVMLLFSSFFSIWLLEADGYGGFRAGGSLVVLVASIGTRVTIGACMGSEPRFACKICFRLVWGAGAGAAYSSLRVDSFFIDNFIIATQYNQIL